MGFAYRMPAVKSNRPVNLSMGQVLAVNLRSPVAVASILHRVSGVVLFLLIPVVLYALQASLASPEGLAQVRESVPLRLLAWVFLAGLIYHFFAGLKHLLADQGVAEELHSGRTAATVMLVLSVLSILAMTLWMWI